MVGQMSTKFVTQLHKGDASMLYVKVAEHKPDHCTVTFAPRPYSVASKAVGQESWGAESHCQGIYIFTSSAGWIPSETWWEDGELAKEELIKFWNRRSRVVSRNLNLRVLPEVQFRLWTVSNKVALSKLWLCRLRYSVVKGATGTLESRFISTSKQ